MNLAIAISRSKTKLIILIFFLSLSISIKAQFSMGSEPGEVYFTTNWYIDVNTDTVYIMLITSKNYGQNFSINHVVGIYNFMGHPPFHWIFPDAADDTLYMKYADTLRISYDDGITWQNKNIQCGSIDWISTGSIVGEIFMNDYGALSFSTDFGMSFSFMNNIIGQQKVGVDNGSLYIRRIEDTFYIDHSFDYGVTFDTFIVPPEVEGEILEGRYPEFTRGALPGEIYLISWHDPTHFKLFRSTDYGESFTMQYEQNTSNYLWYADYFICGGRAEGEFYYIELEPWAAGYYYKLNIYYSTDYAQTFTKFTHHMDENWNGTAAVEEYITRNISNFPNPCNDYTIFNIPEFSKYINPSVEIFNITGQKVLSIPVNNRQTKYNFSGLPAGTYLYRLKTGESFSEIKKFIIIK